MSSLKLREIRTARGLTLREVAEKMDTTAASISRYEREPQRVNVPLIEKFSRTYKCSPAEILGLVPTQGANAFNQIVDIPAYEPNKFVTEEAPTLISLSTAMLSKVEIVAETKLSMMFVRGDSMARTLLDGDIVLVDKSARTVNSEGLYVIKVADQHVEIRWIAINPMTRLLDIRPDNAAYQAYKDVDQSRVQIVGRIVWYTHWV